ncbi:hypothetical protein MRA01_47580 [Methylobacterium radiotolerans]|nr:hypothetical protein MRA01_47580 [Methylobacterium radiotolerans]
MWPASRAATAREMHSVLLPLPPFCVTKVIAFIPGVLQKAPCIRPGARNRRSPRRLCQPQVWDSGRAAIL